jgi:hypothetical protein
LSELDADTLNARLLGGHRLLVTRGPNNTVTRCIVEFFDEPVPLSLFNTYLANGMIAPPKDGVGYAITTEGKKRLSVRGRR